METKKAIRREIAARRKAAEESFLREASQKIAETVVALPEFQEASCIYTYIDYNHEVETRPVIEAAWRAGKKVAVPKVEGKNMTFYLLEDYGQLKGGYSGIPEPEREMCIRDRSYRSIGAALRFPYCQKYYQEE